MQQQPDSGINRPGRPGFDWALLLTRALAVSVEVFLHDRFGARYFGAQCVLAPLLMLLCLALFPNASPVPLLIVLANYLIACVVAAISARRRRSDGQACHSYYTGRSHLTRLLPCFGELTVKHRIEPVLTFLAGSVAARCNPPLAVYLMAAGLSLVVNGLLFEVGERVRLNDMTDAFLDQRRLAERFRERMRD